MSDSFRMKTYAQCELAQEVCIYDGAGAVLHLQMLLSLVVITCGGRQYHCM